MKSKKEKQQLTSINRAQQQRNYEQGIMSDKSIFLLQNAQKSRNKSKWLMKMSHIQKKVSISTQKIAQQQAIQFKRRTIEIPKLESKSKNIFFTAVNSVQREPFSAQSINKSIEKTNALISVIKQQGKKFIKFRFPTQPTNISKDNSVFFEKNNEERFSYLRRTFINRKNRVITETVLEKFKNKQNDTMINRIQQKSRKFLLQKMKKDYRNYVQYDNVNVNHIKNLLQQELSTRKLKYNQCYNQRYSSPYFSFLSLSPSQKKNVLKKQESRSLPSI